MAFRKPWQNGAKAYHEADTFADALEGFKRVRKTKMFHMPNTGEAGDEKCSVCGGTLREVPIAKEVTDGSTILYTGTSEPKPDRWSTWDYSPSRKAVGNGRHYTCSWVALMGQIFKVYRAL